MLTWEEEHTASAMPICILIMPRHRKESYNHTQYKGISGMWAHTPEEGSSNGTGNWPGIVGQAGESPLPSTVSPW